MPWFSYHSGHSGDFCRHAKGSLSAVIERAIETGFSHYGLSEHCPRYRAVDLFEGEEDLGPDGLAAQFQAYFREANALRERYAGRIEILVGFETERLPPNDWAAQMTRLREETQADYIVGSVHDVNGVCIDFSPERSAALARELGGVAALQIAYFEALGELVTELEPEVVGHIDLIRKFDGDDAHFADAVWPHIERTLEAVRAAGSVLDVNAGAYRRGLSPVYPLPAILARARQMGIGVTLGDDGHGEHDVGVGLDTCMRAIADAGYREVAYFSRANGPDGTDGPVRRLDAPIETVAPNI